MSDHTQKDNEVNSSSTDNVNDLNISYGRSYCHDIGCRLKGIKEYLANAATQEQVDII